MSFAGVMVAVAVAAAAFTVFRFFGAFLLGVVAWLLVAIMALSLVAGIEVPASVVVACAVFWAGSQLHTRVRLGQFRSTVLRELEWQLVGRRRPPLRPRPRLHGEEKA